MAASSSFSPRKPMVFVSHSSQDDWIALQIARRIRECGADCFIDKDSIPYGDSIDAAIIDNAKDATEFLVLLTPWGIERPYVMLELGLFYQDGKHILGVVHGLSAQQRNALEFGLSLGGVKGPVTTKTGPRDLDPEIVGRLPGLLRETLLIGLNDIEAYFDQLRLRVQVWEGRHVKKKPGQRRR